MWREAYTMRWFWSVLDFGPRLSVAIGSISARPARGLPPPGALDKFLRLDVVNVCGLAEPRLPETVSSAGRRVLG